MTVVRRRPAGAVLGTCDSKRSCARDVFAVVTGSNKGIGFEICRQLLQAGVFVILTARSEERGREAIKHLQQQSSVRLALDFVRMDVSDDESVAEGAEQISQITKGRLDILVNNAGVAYLDSSFHPDEARDTVNTNAIGTMRASRALLPLLSKSAAGRIVNVASIESSLVQISRPLQQRVTDSSLTDKQIVSLMENFVAAVASGRPRRKGWGGTMYHASKVGQLAFAESLARELLAVKSNVTVASACPGFCRTDMSAYCYGPGLGHKSAAEGADTIVWLALMSPDQARKSHGRFYTDRKYVPWP